MSDGDHGTPADGTPEDFLSALWRRAKEHRVAQWTVGYVAVAYGIQHAVILTSESFEWPNIVARGSMLAFVLGLPLVIVFAWYHGEQTTKRISRGELSIISLLLVAIAILFYVFVRPSAENEAAPAAREASVAGTRSAAALPNGAISLAVLPFVNLSPDKDQEFFSDGMTEEITAALAQVKGLRVVGRTSAFAFKGKNEDIRSIAQALGATHVIEGSVRKAGNRLRITAQLIKASDNSHLWAQNYDRELNDVFAIQEDIAKAITASLQIPLGLKQGETLVSNRTGQTESYEDYLRAKALVRGRGFGDTLNAPIALLEQVVARDPNYAPAWALLAQSYALAPNYDLAYQKGSVAELRRVVDVSLPKAEAASRRAVQLDPRSADAYTGLGQFQMTRSKLLDAEQSFKLALSLDPLNPDTLHLYGDILATVGQLKEAIAVREQLRAVEPLVPVFNSVTDRILWTAGDNDGALVLAQALPSNFGSRYPDLARIYAAMKRYKEAADAVQGTPAKIRELYAPGAMETVEYLLRNAPAPAPKREFPYLGNFTFVFTYAGLPERALEWSEYEAATGYTLTATTPLIWQRDYAPARKTERFKELVRKLGMVDYWRAKGWPEFCHPVGADDFACN